MQKDNSRNRFGVLWTLIKKHAFLGFLLAFTGYRTVDLVSRTLPSQADILAFVALVAFDGGIIIWNKYYNSWSKSNDQVWIAAGMVVVDFIAMSILFISHILINEDFYQVSPQTVTNIGTVVIWTLAIGTIVNIGAFLAHNLFDPDEQLARARRDVEAETNAKAVELTRARSSEVASRLAPRIAQDILNKAGSGRVEEHKQLEAAPLFANDHPALPAPQQQSKRGPGRPSNAEREKAEMKRVEKTDPLS